VRDLLPPLQDLLQPPRGSMRKAQFAWDEMAAWVVVHRAVAEALAAQVGGGGGAAGGSGGAAPGVGPARGPSHHARVPVAPARPPARPQVEGLQGLLQELLQGCSAVLPRASASNTGSVRRHAARPKVIIKLG
jgi:hypothetical protein